MMVRGGGEPIWTPKVQKWVPCLPDTVDGPSPKQRGSISLRQGSWRNQRSDEHVQSAARRGREEIEDPQLETVGDLAVWVAVVTPIIRTENEASCRLVKCRWLRCNGHHQLPYVHMYVGRYHPSCHSVCRQVESGSAEVDHAIDPHAGP